jgi:hypothetical protein
MSIASPILSQIRRLGYVVRVRRTSRSIELRAVLVDDTTHRYIARCADGGGDAHEYAAACELARMIGINTTSVGIEGAKPQGASREGNG